jgi:hypothetical protein
MKIRLTVAAAAGAALLVGAPVALAHNDSTADSGACDTSNVRGGHHGTPGSADVLVPLGGGYEVWAPGGHYVARGPGGYVEVIGGQGYAPWGDQGGFVQGEVDPGAGVDADFHAGTYAGQNNVAEGFACVNVANQRVATPPSVGGQP